MIQVLFNILFVILPLVFFKNTSELFEFNKIIVVYLFTILITASWIYKSIKHKTFIFRRTILDIPIVIYLGVLTISTIFSIDPHTSIFGYYSRFNGGLLSQISYALLYFAYVANVGSLKQKMNIIYSGLIGTFLASILAIMEHFGIFTTCFLMGFPINNSCWVQDVQTRVFSTLGQPNWLAALLVIFIPITWHMLINSDRKWIKSASFLFSIVFFLTLVFTKSRSGLLALGFEGLVFWGYFLFKNFKNTFKNLIVISIPFAIIFLFLFPNSILETLKLNNFSKQSTEENTAKYQGPALESGGTESGVIRRYVWTGAINIFKSYPLFGTGLETFAYIFPKFKPAEHNLTSEWDFIYNKAHNEYLNFLATTGIFGFCAYLFLIIYSIRQIVGNIKHNDHLGVSLLSSYISILITNFFGFSVTQVSLLFFLIPAFALNTDENKNIKFNKFESKNKLKIYTLLLTSISLYLLYLLFNYFKADILYNTARNLDRERKYKEAKEYIDNAIKLNSNESIYYGESGVIHSEIALLDEYKENEEKIKENIDIAIANGIKAINLSKNNTNNYRLLSSTYYKFAMFNNEYLLIAEEPLEVAKTISVMDPKIYYQLGILNIKNNKIQLGLNSLEKAIQLKPNYKEGRFALGLTYIDVFRYQDAIDEFQYILDNIDPNDDLTKKYLEEAVTKL